MFKTNVEHFNDVWQLMVTHTPLLHLTSFGEDWDFTKMLEKMSTKCVASCDVGSCYMHTTDPIYVLDH